MDDIHVHKQYAMGVFSATVNAQQRAGVMLHHDAKILHFDAAVLIAGHAGLPTKNVVWVDSNPQKAWLNRNDEKKTDPQP
jgi:hypothetical protein